MQVYQVTYEGLFDGGKAIVLANSPEQSIELVKAQVTLEYKEYPPQLKRRFPWEKFWNLAKAELIDTRNLRLPKVLYNNDGDQ